MNTQPDYIDFPLECGDPKIDCTVCYDPDMGVKIQTKVLIVTESDYDFSIPSHFAQVLGIASPERIFSSDEEIEEIEELEEINEYVLEVAFPFLKEPIEIKVSIGNDERHYCCISLCILSRLCSRVEINFEKKIVRLHGLKI